MDISSLTNQWKVSKRVKCSRRVCNKFFMSFRQEKGGFFFFLYQVRYYLWSESSKAYFSWYRLMAATSPLPYMSAVSSSFGAGSFLISVCRIVRTEDLILINAIYPRKQQLERGDMREEPKTQKTKIMRMNTIFCFFLSLGWHCIGDLAVVWLKLHSETYWKVKQK